VLDILPIWNVWLRCMARRRPTRMRLLPPRVAEPAAAGNFWAIWALQERPVGEIVDSLGLGAAVGGRSTAGVAGGGTVNVRRDWPRMPIEPMPRRSDPARSGRKHLSDSWRINLSRVKERAERKQSVKRFGTGFQSKEEMIPRQQELRI